MRLSDFVGQGEARLGLVLNAIDPRCGGILLVGGKGSGKSTLARLFRGILPADTPYVELPLNATEDSLLGSIDLEATLRTGVRTLQPGILSRAHGGVVFVDDINLLSRELLALLMESRDRGVELIEREGLSERRECRFTVLATMNPEEGDLSPHVVDRFGLCAVMDPTADISARCAVMRLAQGNTGFVVDPDSDVADRVSQARSLLPSVRVPPDALDYLADVAGRNASPGHRGDLFLQAASRAFAALQCATEVQAAHVDRVAGLVFAHRRLLIREEEQASAEQDPSEQPESGQPQKQEDGEQRMPRSGSGEKESDNESTGKGDQELEAVQRESSSREEVMQVGTPFKVRRLGFHKDRQKRKAVGRRTKTKSKGRGGRHVKSLFHSAERDIAIDATLRACAPYQNARGRQGLLLIERDDLRFRQRERKMGHMVLFVVDGSGSMGAQRRMVEAKGAIQSLLMDCYQKRDRVALIVFRKERAELVLPPTSSVELAARKLSVLPVGGKTPLASGLLETHRLIERVGLRHPEMRFLVVVITDGRGNQPLPGSTRKDEVGSLARLLAARRQCDFIVVDTENKNNFLHADLALELARQLEADYYTIEALKAEYLSELIQAGKSK